MKTNLMVQIMIGLIGLLLLLAALQFVGWGRGIGDLEPAQFDESQIEQLVTAKDDLAAPEIKPEVIERITGVPLFRDDRQPFVPPPSDLSLADVEPIEEPPKPLKAKVTSIIITNSNRYVMLQDQLTNEQLTLEQGMPLPGEQGLWIVETIDSRKVTFTADGQEPVELELEIFSGGLSNNQNNVAQNRAREAKQQNQKSADVVQQLTPEQLRQQSAEEIRKKIAERRAEMRAKAAQGNEQ